MIQLDVIRDKSGSSSSNSNYNLFRGIGDENTFGISLLRNRRHRYFFSSDAQQASGLEETLRSLSTSSSPPPELLIDTELSLDDSQNSDCCYLFNSSPSLSSFTSFSSNDSLDLSQSSSSSSSERSLPDTSTSTRSNKTGLSYPILFILIASCILLPMKVILYSHYFDNESYYDMISHYMDIHLGLFENPHAKLFQGSTRKRSLTNIIRSNPDTSGIDALVFIAVGPAATSPVLGWSIHSMVKFGGWDGPVYVITDSPSSVQYVIQPPNTTPSPDSFQPKNLNIIQLDDPDMPSSLSAFNAKLTKCKLLDILPNHLQHVVYIDSDIITAKPLQPFWDNVKQVWESQGEYNNNVIIDDDYTRYDYDIPHDIKMSMGLFQDCKSYTAGYCKDCDTWNTGVMTIKRGYSDSCLQSWCDTLQIMGGSDQAALDVVIQQGQECQNIQPLNHKQHVRMMKDIFVVWGLIGTKTFNHFTGIFRPKNLSKQHRTFYERMLGSRLIENQQVN